MKTLQLNRAICKTNGNINHIQLFVTINGYNTCLQFDYDTRHDTTENIVNDLTCQLDISTYKNYDQLIKAICHFSKPNPRFYNIDYKL